MGIGKDNDSADDVRATCDWRDRLQLGLGEHMELLAKVVAGEDATPHEIRFDLIKHGPRSVCLIVEVSGHSRFLKLFDGQAGDDAYQREKKALFAMQSSGLVPKLYAFSDPCRFILTEVLSRDEITNRESMDDPEWTGRNVGEWVAKYDAAAPWEPACGNWYGYLSKFGTSLALDVDKDAPDRLLSIPLCGRGLAHNDPALHNYLLTDAGVLVGCDFEHAMMRPRGWDYLITYHALIERYAEKATTALEAFSDAFAHFHKGALIVDELNTLARTLYCAQALAGQKRSEAMTWR